MVLVSAAIRVHPSVVAVATYNVVFSLCTLQQARATATKGCL